MGDKGGTTTKFGAFLPISPANSPYNFTLFGIYIGDDNRKNLEEKFELVSSQISNIVSISGLDVEW